MEFLTVSMLVEAFHYTSKLEAKQKGNACFMNKPRGRTSNKKSSADSDKSKHPSQPTSPNLGYHKNNFRKEKKDHIKQAPTRKWCDYHNLAWHDTSECKARKTFLEKLLTSDLSDRTLVEYDTDVSTLLALNSTTPIALTTVNEEE